MNKKMEYIPYEYGMSICIAAVCVRDADVT